MVIQAMVFRAERERRVWLAERAAESKETEEVKRTGPASPAPRAQGRRKGEDDEQATGKQREQSGQLPVDLAHLWGNYQPYDDVLGLFKLVLCVR